MADKDISIEIKTKADTSGAEAAKKALDEVARAGEQATSSSVNPMADGSQLRAGNRAEEVRETTEAVEEQTDAIKKQADALEDLADAAEKTGDEAEDSGAKLDKLVSLERARVAADIARVFGQVAGVVGNVRRELGGADADLDKTLKNVETGLNSVEGALAGAAQGFAVGGPLGAAVGGFIGLATGPLKSAFDDMVADLKGAADAEEGARISTENYNRALAARKVLLQELAFDKFWSAEEDRINSATAALRRQTQELAARRRANEAERELGQNTALAGGADPRAVGNADIAGDIRDRLAALEERQAAAASAVANLEEAASAAALKAQDAAQQGIEGFKDLQKEADNKAKEVEEAKKDLESSETIAAEERRVILAELGGRVLDATKALEEEAAAKANEVVAEIQASGAQLADSNRAGLAAVQAITEDGRVTASEQQRLSEALAASMAGIRANTDSFIRITEGINEATRGHTARISALEREVQALVNRASTPGRSQ